jgi:NAD(P)-dependent dehydrogenase (short-subunit alcohol dehydrogenase family)
VGTSIAPADRPTRLKKRHCPHAVCGELARLRAHRRASGANGRKLRSNEETTLPRRLASINNAGYGRFGMIEELTEEEVRSQLETNLFGALWVTQAGAADHARAGSGHIIQVQAPKALLPNARDTPVARRPGAGRSQVVPNTRSPASPRPGRM